MGSNPVRSWLIAARIASIFIPSTAVHTYDFHLFTVIYLLKFDACVKILEEEIKESFDCQLVFAHIFGSSSQNLPKSVSSPFNFNSLALRTATVSLHEVGRYCRENSSSPLSTPLCKRNKKYEMNSHTINKLDFNLSEVFIIRQELIIVDREVFYLRNDFP